MPEINPYEPPQTESKSASNEKPHAQAAGSEFLDWVVFCMLNLQILAAVFIIVYAFLRAPLRELLGDVMRISAISCLGLGVLLLLIATARKYTKLLIFELLVLAVFFSLQMIHIARH